MKSISIIIVNRNDKINLDKCIHYINIQNYPKDKIEILVIDGNSSDKSIEVSIKYQNVKFLNLGYEDDMEARRYLGIKQSKNELICFIDTDNFIVDKNFFIKMTEPFFKEKGLLGVFTKWYLPSKQISILDNYYALIGGNDPIAYYLNRNDRVEYNNNKLPNKNTILLKNLNNYSLVKFDYNDYPVIGCNGFLFSKEIISKYILKNPKMFFHTDYFKYIDENSNEYNKYAIINCSLIHKTGKNLYQSLKKRINYSNRYFFESNYHRTYVVFDPKNIKDIYKIIKISLLSVTLIEPFLRSIYYSIKVKNPTWLLHTFILLLVVISYAVSVILRVFKIKSV